MKLVIVLCLVALAQAQQQRYSSAPGEVQILRFDNENGINSYKFGYETSNSISHDEQGQLKNEGRDDEALSVSGRYSWLGPDGVTYTVIYTADENGYRPQIEQGPGGAVPGAVVASLLG